MNVFTKKEIKQIKKLFGSEMLYLVIDNQTNKIDYDCNSPLDCDDCVFQRGPDHCHRLTEEERKELAIMFPEQLI